MAMNGKKDWMRWLNKMGLYRIDWYIVTRFLGTFAFTLVLILAIIVVIDVQEKLESFMKPGMTFRIIFDYYMALIPYFAVLLSPLFIFITVVFFTSQLAGRSEIIAMQAAGMSFKRLLRPYMFSASILALISFAFSSEMLPKLNKTRISFTDTWVFNQKVTMDRNLQAAVSPGVIAYFGTFDTTERTGYNFSLEKFDSTTLVSRLTAPRIVYDSTYHWTIYDYNIRHFDGLKERNESGSMLDTMLLLNPADLVISKEDGEQLTTRALQTYINRQKKRGMGNIQNFQVEFHRRFASIPAAFILTLIGACLSARKVKGGLGLNIAIGLLLAFSYILLFTISSSYAINGALSPFVAAWLPNFIFIPIAIFFFWRAPR